MVKADADFRLVTVLTPIGGPFKIGLDSDTAYRLTDVLPLIDETSVHLKSKNSEYQLWRMWPNQLALCYGSPTQAAAATGGASSSATQSEPQKGQNTPPEQGFHIYGRSLIWRGQGKSTGNTGVGNGGGSGASASSGGNKSGGGGGGGGSTAQVATPVMPLVGFVPYSECFAPIYLLTPSDDNGDREFQVNLRSVRGAIEYLGALLRSSDGTIQTESKSIFSLSELTTSNKQAARITTTFDGNSYAVTDPTSADVVTILSELIGALKLSSDIATTKQVQIIP
jgi:hypothetical protein